MNAFGGIERRTRERIRIPRQTREFWSAAQRQACVIHEISYRACFKPQVPRYFIERFSRAGDTIYDPFMGRGTTPIEALLCGRRAIGNDINPLSLVLVEPRVDIPLREEVEERLRTIRIRPRAVADLDLSMFYHRKTESEIVSVKEYLESRRAAGAEDRVDRWIRMIATNRLTGHSPGFFSVYTLPPNQAASPEEQKRINRQRRQKPPYRDVKALILRKSDRLLGRLTPEERAALSGGRERSMLLAGTAAHTPSVEAESIQLTVTSPPFLNIVNYARDNWLRCWFNGIDPEQVALQITQTGTLDEWKDAMSQVLRELFRVTRPSGYVAFEVGEIRKQTLRLDEVILPLGMQAGFLPRALFINRQKFTKTSHIWGIRNNVAGTNTNRIVLLQKPS